MRQLLLILFLTTGWNKLFTDVTGSVDGNKLEGITAFWGGPHIVIANAELDCMDMSWVDPYGYDDGEELQTSETFNALHIIYESEEVQDGKMTIAKFSTPATAWYMIVEEGATEVWQATSGSIDLEIDKKERISGNFEAGFGDDGSLKGDFLIERCENLKKRKHAS